MVIYRSQGHPIDPMLHASSRMSAEYPIEHLSLSPVRAGGGFCPWWLRFIFFSVGLAVQARVTVNERWTKEPLGGREWKSKFHYVQARKWVAGWEFYFLAGSRLVGRPVWWDVWVFGGKVMGSIAKS